MFVAANAIYKTRKTAHIGMSGTMVGRPPIPAVVDAYGPPRICKDKDIFGRAVLERLVADGSEISLHFKVVVAKGDIGATSSTI